MPERALVTGITGQDGSYLAELLLAKGYEVHGVIRRASTFNTERIHHVYQDPHGEAVRLFLHIYNVQPDEIYHLGAQSHVRVSFDIPEFTGDITGMGITRVLEAVRRSGKMHEAKVRGAAEVGIWGSGTPRREFLYSDDAADACVFLMNLPEEKLKRIVPQDEMSPLVNIGCGQDITIRELAELIAEVVGFKGCQIFDSSRPDGTPRKLLNTSRLTALGWKPQISLREGLEKTYQDFCENISKVTHPSLVLAEWLSLSEVKHVFNQPI